MTSTTATNVSRHWSDGAWRGGGAIRSSTSPSNGRALGDFFDDGGDEARQAFSAARAAFDRSGWSTDRSVRSRALVQLADRLEERADAIALMLCREGGKLHQQTQWEVGGSVEWLR